MTNVLTTLYGELELSKDVQNLIQEIDAELKSMSIRPSDLQWRILINHVNEMMVRAKEGLTLPEVDAQLFSEISPTSIQLAQKIVARIGNLSQDEKYLLSIHFEAAKEN